MSDATDPVPLPRERRLKSLDEFDRPWWYPKFEIVGQSSKGLSSLLLVVIGLFVGALIGLFVLD